MFWAIFGDDPELNQAPQVDQQPAGQGHDADPPLASSPVPKRVADHFDNVLSG